MATRQGLLEEAKEGKDKNDGFLAATGEARPEEAVDGLRRGDAAGSAGKVGGGGGAAPRDRTTATFGAGGVAKEKAERKAGEAQKLVRDQPAAPPSGAPAAPSRALAGLKAAANDDEGDKDQEAARKRQPSTATAVKAPAATALHQLARSNQSRGQLADACSQYGQLVRGYLAYDQRAAALLEWAKCEAARGNHALAETLLKQLIAQYPKLQLAAQQLLANVQNERANVARRAQRSQSNVAPKSQGQRAKPAKKASDTSQ
jgi:hypothetical protein